MVVLDASGAALAAGTSTAGSSRKSSLSTKLSLLTLTFQNSAVILIMHYSRIMPTTSDHRFFTSTAVVLHELLKMSLSLTLAIYESSKTLAPSTPASVLLEQIYNSVFSADGWTLLVPALGYTVQNLLQYIAVGNLDAVHFQVLYQLKILITAISSVFILRRSLGSKRWFSLVVLTVGVTIVSLPSAASFAHRADALLLHGMADHFFPRSKHELGQASSDLSSGAHLNRRSATYEGIDVDQPPPQLPPTMNYSLGLSCVLIAASSSAIAGVYFEKVLKEKSSSSSVWIRNVQISFYSMLMALVGGVWLQDGAGIAEHGFFEGYNSVVWIVIVLQAVGGMIGSLVILHSDNIIKNFATSISIILSFLVSVWMFDFKVTGTFLFGTSLVLLSTYLYGIADRGFHRPSPIQIVNFEKTAIERIFTPRATPKGTPRMTEAARLNTDPFDSKFDNKALSLTSSRPSSPMLARQASRGNIKRAE